MPLPERYTSMMHVYLNRKPNHSDANMFNQQLNMLPESKVNCDNEAKRLGFLGSNYHIGVPRQLNVRSDVEKVTEFLGETIQSEIGYYPSKRQRIESPINLNPPSSNDSSRLPSPQQYQDPTLIVERKVPIPLKSFEKVPSYPRRCLDTHTTPVYSPETVSGCSDVTKADVMENSPLDNKHVQGLGASKSMKSARGNLVRVFTFEDLFSSKKEIKADTKASEEKPLKHEKLGSGVDVVEPMECDEQTKCEVNYADTVPLEKRNKSDVSQVERVTEDEIKLHIKSLKEGRILVTKSSEEKPLKHEKQGSGVDVVEPMECDEQTKFEVNADTVPLEKRNKRDVSLVERFTEDEIKLHIKSLKEGSIKGRIRETCELEEDPCQLCGDGPILFPAEPIYCSLCSRRIKAKSLYHIPEEKISDAQHQICNPCYKRCRSKFTLSGVSISKANMLKKNNADNQNTEEWVCCGSCGKWQHQICGLYNLHKDIDKTADYICPYCLLEERQSMNSTGFHDNTDLGAKDLPETILSHFIEQRLFRRLKEERHQTASQSDEDVSEPDDLTLRVVFSAEKTSYVNKTYAELFHKEHYPSEFPYRSKVILLFQKVEGVDICIFAMFVQEFGSECSQPNQRSMYISYLDSVKYFRPERVTFSGEALRTFVYHEILIGYLEYCKIRGFTKGYIWACPPPKGEDYIMYSHPKTQQTPNTKKLRQWYESMLDKAEKQGVVTNVTNLYNRFFVSTEESTCNITAARLPYFEGSFWSYNAELLTQEIERVGDNELQKKVKAVGRRALKGNKSKDGVDVDDAKNILLMRKLEKMISQNKEDLIVVDLNGSCTRCSQAILSGLRWSCEKCKNLQLCEKCHDREEELPGEHTHNMNGKEKHSLSKVQVNGIQSTTEDNDVILENSMFESRQVFLGFSQKHNYSFDTLRRAKHSSMMILHHLHTSNKHHRSQDNSSLCPVTCTVCRKDVSTTIYYSCLICSDYRACTACYTKKKVLRLLHLFPKLPSRHGTPPRTVGALGMLDAFLHAHACRPTAAGSCSYPKCNDVKKLFNHRVVCEIKKQGDCKFCFNIRKMISIHAYHCQNPNCPIPRCRDMKKQLITSCWRL